RAVRLRTSVSPSPSPPCERSPDRSQGGLGLGLTLVRSLTALHGGHVEAHSEGPGKGSEFIVHLPRLGEAQEAAMRPAASSAHGDGTLRVMVVDDNADAALSLAMLLESMGYLTTVEYDARRALERAAGEAPDVLLLDIGLPDMDGYTLARRLRAMPATRHALLIAVTGYGQAEDRERSREAGFDFHLVKPVDTARLAELLGNYGRQARRA
ncbi:MAG TPA: response regulator, partial [Noviherbaspirillum sp.]|nr:response regulator [Noviherbaspirillum sp.]